MSGFDPKAKKFATVNGKRMAYVDVGNGAPVLLLHGNPTSSWLWRGIIPHVLDENRAIAPDLIGMGDSEKLDNPGSDSYRFVEHRDYLNGLLDQILPDEKVVLVIHDWGSALGFDWARRNPDRVRGICFMEAIVAPLSFDEFPEPVQPVFKAFRSEKGEEMVLEHNFFVEKVLTGSIIRDLADDEMAEYRRPFANPGEDRRPTLTWPRQIPFDGEPADVNAIVSDYSAWLGETGIPKLFVDAKPGAILRGRLRDLVRGWPNVTEVQVPGIHFIQEDSADEIGDALKGWMKGLGA